MLEDSEDTITTVMPTEFQRVFERGLIRCRERPVTAARTLLAVQQWAIKKVKALTAGQGLVYAHPRITTREDFVRKMTHLYVSISYAPLPGREGEIYLIPEEGKVITYRR